MVLNEMTRSRLSTALDANHWMHFEVIVKFKLVYKNNSVAEHCRLHQSVRSVNAHFP